MAAIITLDIKNRSACRTSVKASLFEQQLGSRGAVPLRPPGGAPITAASAPVGAGATAIVTAGTSSGHDTATVAASSGAVVASNGAAAHDLAGGPPRGGSPKQRASAAAVADAAPLHTAPEAPPARQPGTTGSQAAH